MMDPGHIHLNSAAAKLAPGFWLRVVIRLRVVINPVAKSASQPVMLMSVGFEGLSF